jgi:hypothetical protein
MKGIFRKALAGFGLAIVIVGAQGCYAYRDCVDPCYPERYWASSTALVHEAFAPQVHNGHVLDQTVWNWQFEPGTDRLTAGGLEHLAYLARRRPHPDPCVYLQTAQDVVYDPSIPERMQVARQELDLKRKVAIERFLIAQTGGKGVDFQIMIHDPSDPSLNAIPANAALQQMFTTRFRGGLPGGGVLGGSFGGTGGGGGGSGTGGGPR